MSNKFLDHFGLLLISNVRDESIRTWLQILDGQMKGKTAERMHGKFVSFSSNEISVIKEAIPEIVDSVLHHLLWTLEQHDDIRLSVKIADAVSNNLADISDGLSGELPTSEGWIGRFSSYPEGTS